MAGSDAVKHVTHGKQVKSPSQTQLPAHPAHEASTASMPSAPSSMSAGSSMGTAPAPARAGSAWDAMLAVGSVLVVALVGLVFTSSANRMFDVPKALVLKVGGGGIFLVWLFAGLYGHGWPTRSMRVFLGPVAALVCAVLLSTLFSIDVPTSMSGVYERQFGLYGFLSCVGLYAVTSTCIRSRRGAFAALAVLSLVGGAMGAYAWLQSRGQDPFGFFPTPSTQTASYLGNANFSGNALALLFPLALALSVTAAMETLRSNAQTCAATSWTRAVSYVVGLCFAIALALGPGIVAADRFGMGTPQAGNFFASSVAVLLLVPLMLTCVGSYGPAWTRDASLRNQRIADAAAAGMLAASTLCIAAGIITTRTRGAWVGTAVAIFGGMVLVPKILHRTPSTAKKARNIAWAVGGVLVLLVSGMLVFFPSHNWSRTIVSIPRSFDPNNPELGRGQGTRRYLWSESVRVLLHHDATLDRMATDREERIAKVRSELLPGVVMDTERRSAEDHAFEKAWRRPLVWLTGIGVETYRYAFMSHKSKKLEALDQMTNHDNPHNNYLYVLASFGLLGLAAYLALLARLFRVTYRRCTGADGHDDTLTGRTVALGAAASALSYATYSIAGFDSLASSAFLFFILGAIAAFLEPSGDAPKTNLVSHVRALWPLGASSSADPAPSRASIPARIVLGLGLGGLLILTIGGGLRAYVAERAFAGDKSVPRDFYQNIADIETAMRLRPEESFYKQALGASFAMAARQSLGQAQELQRLGRTDEAARAEAQASEFVLRAETALYASLEHTWSPENVFLSLFQLYLMHGRAADAEHALARTLDHSPHLGPVRANLARMKLERGAGAEALADCRWVLDVDPKDVAALVTCGKASVALGARAEAKSYLERAQQAAPNDASIRQELDALIRSDAATAAP